MPHPVHELAEAIDGGSVQAATFNGHRSVLVAGDGPKWRPRPPGEQAKRPGSRMIGIATVLLFALGAGLLGVSFAAQYAYVDTQRHQHAASGWPGRACRRKSPGRAWSCAPPGPR
jgi:hypothetical protein